MSSQCVHKTSNPLRELCLMTSVRHKQIPRPASIRFFPDHWLPGMEPDPIMYYPDELEQDALEERWEQLKGIQHLQIAISKLYEGTNRFLKPIHIAGEVDDIPEGNTSEIAWIKLFRGGTNMRLDLLVSMVTALDDFIDTAESNFKAYLRQSEPHVKTEPVAEYVLQSWKIISL